MDTTNGTASAQAPQAQTTPHSVGSIKEADRLQDLFLPRSSRRAQLIVRAGDTITLREPLEGAHLERHVRGEARYGAIPFVDEERVGWGCIDLDFANWKVDPVGAAAFCTIRQIVDVLRLMNFRCHVERSRRKGWHVWMFFEAPVLARDLRGLVRPIALKAGARDGADLVCPRQDRNTKIGSGTFLPCFGADTDGHTRFHHWDAETSSWRPVPDQAAYIAGMLADLTPASAVFAKADTEGCERSGATTGEKRSKHGAGETRTSEKSHRAAPVEGPIEAGARNSTLLSLAGTMRRPGMSAEAIEAALQAENSNRCRPPLPEAEVRAIARSIARYEPAAAVNESQDPERFFTSKGVLIVPPLGEEIRSRGPVTPGHDGRLYRYVEGVYRSDGDLFVRAQGRKLLGLRYKRRHVEEALAYLRAEDPQIKADEQPQGMVNLRNGLLDWRTLELSPHTPAVLSTLQVPHAWNPDARCPGIERFLEEVLPDAAGLIFELMGYALLTANPLRKAFLFLGPGQNGKSVLLHLIVALCGRENVSTLPLQTLAEERFARARLLGRLANVCGDLDARAIHQTDAFKMLTGGDVMTGEWKYGAHFDFRPFATPIFSANEAPISADQSEGWFDRWIVVPMERRIPESQVDPHLVQRLTTTGELEGLLVLAVKGLRRLMERGRFDLPPSAQRARGAYRERLDTVAAFFAEDCELAPLAWTSRALLYRAYSTSAREGGRLPVSAANFNDRLRSMFGERIREVKRHGTVGWAGIAYGPERQQ